MPRLIDESVERYLKAFGAVEIVGAKWCGKTWAALAHAESEIHLDDQRMRELAEADLTLALEGKPPHLVDEWQEVPALWDAARRAIDSSGERGLYILTGSSVPKKEEVTHSGAGRIARLRMRPMTLSESGHSSNTVSFSGLFDGKFKTAQVNTDLRRIALYICRGGWPGAIDLNDEAAMLIPGQYLDAAVSSGITKRNRSEQLVRKLLYSLARNIGKSVTKETILEDIKQGEITDKNDSTTKPTLDRYIEFLIDQYLIEEMVGWDAPVKAKSRVRTSPIRSFADPSIPASLLGMSPERLLMDMQVFGNLFEELCLRDLRVYTSIMKDSLPDSVHYYRDSNGLEVDAIVELRDGRWAAIEVKLSENKVSAAINNLKRLKDKVASNPFARNPEPSFMAVLVGKTEFCRKTPEGIYVIPITSLGA
jgi:predicted AAA+ superfamily ATPase